MAEDYVLRMKSIDKEYYGNQVLKGVSLSVRRGEIHGLIGENGAGKSTLMNILFGMPVIHSTGGFSGEIYLNGDKVDIKSPFEAMKMGIGMVHQEFMLIPDFTITENIKINREMYISLTFNRSKSTPVIIAGVSGGVDIENTAQKEADKIFFSEFNSLLGISDFQIRQLSKHLKIENYLDFKNIILAMYHIFKDYDASLVEINPLAMTSEELIAIDSKIDLDEQAAFRHPNLYQQLKEETMPIIGDELQMKTEGDTITFVPLSGNIGLVSDGAGTGLLTMDLLSRYGGTVASFCELGGITSPEVVHKALKQVHQDPNVKSILVVLIGGFNRMDEMAEGIVRFYQETKDNDRTPIYIRMCGTKEEEGKKLMLDAQIPIDNSLHEAVKKAIKKATEN
ncbi:MAG TPA: ATP-binding cassette domain-containing protein [Atribacterota bacterium]|nr:ATP-binding cassette domain-containing protein [Atribacterota bacterium]